MWVEILSKRQFFFAWIRFGYSEYLFFDIWSCFFSYLPGKWSLPVKIFQIWTFPLMRSRVFLRLTLTCRFPDLWRPELTSFFQLHFEPKPQFLARHERGRAHPKGRFKIKTSIMKRDDDETTSVVFLEVPVLFTLGSVYGASCLVYVE